MLRQEIYIQKYDWRVQCFYAVDTYYITEILVRLAEVGCDGDYMFRAKQNMEGGKLNHGLTYSNMQMRESVLVVGVASTAAEFLNSLCHELHHLVAHISKAFGIDFDSETTAYLCGDTARAMFPTIHTLLCDCCQGKEKLAKM